MDYGNWVQSMSDLANIKDIRPIYFLPEDNLAGEVPIPCLSVTQTFDCMVGFFSSRAFVQLAPGLASFLNGPERKLRLIVSPFLVQEDREAIEKGLRTFSDQAGSPGPHRTQLAVSRFYRTIYIEKFTGEESLA